MSFFIPFFFLCWSQPGEIVTTGSSGGHSFEVEKVISGLEIPWGLAFTPWGELWITERKGQISRYDFKSKSLIPVFKVPDVYNRGQGGLLDIYFPEDVKKPGFVTYSKNVSGQGATTLASFFYNQKTGGLKNFKDIIVTSARSPKNVHFGSRIAVNEKGDVFFSTGDRGIRPNGQNLETHGASILRVNSVGKAPSDNPFFKRKKTKPEIWSYGHRNPQGLVYDKENKRLWAIEHGPRGGDELNLIKKGKNYGWPVQGYGKEYSSSAAVGKPIVPGITQPVHYYIPSIAPSGLELYSGKAFPKWKGNLFTGSLALTHLNQIILEGEKFKKEERLLKNYGQRIRTVREGPEGYLYISTDNGQILRIRPLRKKRTSESYGD